MTINEIHNSYKNNSKSPSVMTKEFLEKSKIIDEKIHSCLRFTDDLALVEANECDRLLEKYKHENDENYFEKLVEDYPLFGIPYNLKDNILVEGEIATSASKIIENFKATYSATVYERIRSAGGILISQSNLDEWAVGSSTENSAFGPTTNPFDFTRVSGGSSGGPASNIGSGQSVFSLGSDTGGSIRQPASFCNVVGVKPTYGMVPRYGVMPLASSLDQVGPFTNSVLDNIKVLSVILGSDEYDQTSQNTIEVKNKLELILKNYSMKKYRIGVPKEYFIDGIDPLISQAVKNIIKKLESEGHQIINISLPLTKYGLAVYYTTMTVETASNLQRYDGIRYGSQLPLNPEFEQFVSVRETHFGAEPKRRIMLGTFASSAGYYDAYYNKACKVKKLMSDDFKIAFEKCDLIIAPTVPEFAFKFGEKTSDPIKMYLSDVLVYGANLCKLPSINIPMGFFEKEDQKLSAGIQLMSKEYNESSLYDLALQIEQIVTNN
jgi:aspartyl-tRNA(Asn)/glutamyl-tRNA(Gln) amidotransferase subunit A